MVSEDGSLEIIVEGNEIHINDIDNSDADSFEVLEEDAEAIAGAINPGFRAGAIMLMIGRAIRKAVTGR